MWRNSGFKIYFSVLKIYFKHFMFVLGGGIVSEPHDAHFRGDAVWGGADEDEPLGQEVWDKYQILAEWNRIHKLVPGEDEVGEHENYCSEGDKAASLQERQKHHGADQACIYGDTYTDDAGFRSRCYACEHDCKQGQDAEYDHGQVSFHFCSELSVAFDFSEVPIHEIYYVHDVREREASHLGQEVSA